MSSGKEITTKIKSVENTRKVTSALEMVSASKIRKSQDLMFATRPYTRMMQRIIGHLGKANPEYRHPFTKGRLYRRFNRPGSLWRPEYQPFQGHSRRHGAMAGERGRDQHGDPGQEGFGVLQEHQR
jgi:hypothetical protein